MSRRDIALWSGTLVKLIRSRTLVYAFALSALGVFLISTGGKVTDLTIPVRLVISSYFLALATYLYNDITDYKTDLVNNRKSVHDLEKRRQKITKYYTVMFFIIPTILAFSINLPTGFVSIAFSVLAILYSHPRIHLKNMFVIKTAVTGAGAFLTSMMGCLASGQFSHLGMVSSLIGFLFYFILGPLGDISDLKGDKEDGRRTFPIVLGIKKSFLLMAVATLGITSIFLFSNITFGINLIGVGFGIAITIFMLTRVIKASRIYLNKIELAKCRNAIRYCMFACQISMLVGTTFLLNFRL